MEPNTMTNGNLNKNLHKSRKNATFSQAGFNKSDVGDFQAGYFVMADTTKENHILNNRTKNTHRTPERYPTEKRKVVSPNRPSSQRERPPRDLDSNIREVDSNVSYARLTTSPARVDSPNRNRRYSTPQSTPPIDPTFAPSPPRQPHKANNEKPVDTGSSSDGGSPPRGKGQNRWAGPAFSNAPPPSSLPLPDFPPFNPQSSSCPPSSVSSAASSPSSSPPSTAPITYQEQYFYIQPPFSSHPFSVPLAHLANIQISDIPTTQAPSLAQLSTDLRRMLNISEQPITA